MISEYSSDYPYFIYPAVMALRKGVNDPEEAERLRRIVAANVGDIPALRLMLGIDPEDFASFYPDITAPVLSTNDTIDACLSHVGSQEAPVPPAAAEIPLPPVVTEQNAYALIKKRDYQGALEIIQQLSLNIPEKSIYFADQISFLKKLIFNETRKNNNQG